MARSFRLQRRVTLTTNATNDAGVTQEAAVQAPAVEVEHSTTGSRGAPPQGPLSPAEVRRALHISTLEGAVATVQITISGAIGGSVFLTGFALLLGANNFQLGLLGALPFVGQLFQFVGAYLEQRSGERRNLVLYGSLVGRLIWALLLALPFLSFLQGSELAIFFLGLAISYAANGIAANAWLSWMSDLVPGHERGRYFGVRNTVVALSAMLTTYLAGLALDHFRGQGQLSVGYAVIFGVSLLAALGAALLIARQAEPPLTTRPQASLKAMFGEPLRDGRFRTFIFTSLGWALVTGVASPFFNAYGLAVLELSFSTLALTGIVTGAVALVSGPIIGQWQDRYGNRRILVGCILGTILLPWGWVLSSPENIVPLWLMAILAGIFWPGLNQGLANVLMELAPVESRGPAIAAHSAITGVGTLVAGLLGGAMAMALAEAQIGLGPLTLAGMGFLFALTSLGRAVMALVFWRTL